MDKLTLDMLRRRLDRLERENRQLKMAGVAVVLAFIGTLVMGQAEPRTVAKVIEAQKFVLRDPGGKIRVILGAAYPVMSVAAPNAGQPQYGLFIYGPDGKERARLAEYLYNGSQLVLLSEPMKAVLSLYTMGEPAYSAALRLNSSQNSLKWSPQQDREWAKRVEPLKEELRSQALREDFRKALETVSALTPPMDGHEISLSATVGILSSIAVGPAPHTAMKGTIKIDSMGHAGASANEVSIQGNDGKTKWRVP